MTVYYLSLERVGELAVMHLQVVACIIFWSAIKDIEHDKRNCGIGGVLEIKILSGNQRIDKQFK